MKKSIKKGVVTLSVMGLVLASSIFGKDISTSLANKIDNLIVNGNSIVEEIDIDQRLARAEQMKSIVRPTRGRQTHMDTHTETLVEDNTDNDEEKHEKKVESVIDVIKEHENKEEAIEIDEYEKVIPLEEITKNFISLKPTDSIKMVNEDKVEEERVKVVKEIKRKAEEERIRKEKEEAERKRQEELRKKKIAIQQPHRGISFEGTGNGTNLGTFNATAYDLSYRSCGKNPGHPAYGKTASGVNIDGHSWNTLKAVAVDPRRIPLGSIVRITVPSAPQYNADYIAYDTGGAIKGNKIDIYMGDGDRYTQCREFGRRDVNVEVLRYGW